jgi:membrane dipeptidase
MQLWPDAHFEIMHRHGVTAYAVTAWRPHADLDGVLSDAMYWRLLARKYDNILVAETVEDLRRARRENRAALILHAQGGDWIGYSLHRIEALYRLGLRVMLLSYNRTNQLCDGGLDRTSGGLTRFGERVVDECNRVGVVLDCTHTGKKATLEIMERSAKPCIFSHTNPSHFVPTPRNADDEQIRLCASRGGVIGLVAWGPLVMNPERPHWPTLDEFLDMVDYVVQLTGSTDHIGLSTDMSIGTYPDHWHDPWGEPAYPNFAEAYGRHVTADTRSPLRSLNGFSDYVEIVNVIDGLLARNYSEEDVAKFLGENFMRVYQTVWT